MTTTYCQSCGTQVQDANIKFCSSCGSQVGRPNPQENVTQPTSNVSVVKAKLKPPAIAIIVSVGIGLVQCLYSVMLPDYKVMQALGTADEGIIAAVKALWLLGFPAYAFCIYSALQMMNARKHGFAITSATITILSGFQNLIGFPIGIWALVVLLKPQIKSAFDGNSMPSA